MQFMDLTDREFIKNVLFCFNFFVFFCTENKVKDLHNIMIKVENLKQSKMSSKITNTTNFTKIYVYKSNIRTRTV